MMIKNDDKHYEDLIVMRMVIMMKVVVTRMMSVVVTSVEYQADNTSEHPASLPATILLPA